MELVFRWRRRECGNFVRSGAWRRELPFDSSSLGGRLAHYTGALWRSSIEERAHFTTYYPCILAPRHQGGGGVSGQESNAH